MYPDSKNRKFIMINLVGNLTPNVTLLLHFFFEVAHKIITNRGKVETLIFQMLKAVSGPIWPNFELVYLCYLTSNSKNDRIDSNHEKSKISIL